jgi:hypothetical protein
MHPAPRFAALSWGDLRQLIDQPEQAAQDSLAPQPGSRNRFQVEVEDVEATAAKMLETDAKLRSHVITGNGGKQVLADDPSGNPVELFQPF